MYQTSKSPSDLFKGATLHSSHSGQEDDDSHVAQSNEAAAQASSLPPSLLERGAVTSSAEMTTQYSDEEWGAIVTDVQKAVGSDVEVKKHSFDGPFAKTIDHTLLKLDAIESQFDQLCEEARANNFATVCVRPDWVERCVQNLKGTDVKVASTIGFHEGTYELSYKLRETKLSLSTGALELDSVLNYPQLHDKLYSTIYNELSSLRSAAPHPVTLKLILETSQLSRDEIIAACVLAGAAGYDYVKTSTGFNGEGARVENVRLMRRCCEVVKEKGIGEMMKVKASGGVRSLAAAHAMLEAGASRLGTSSGLSLAKEYGDGGGKSTSGNAGAESSDAY